MHVVFTDLDGTLLDHDTYSYDGALAGIVLLKKRGIPLVLVSSKTLPEMRNLHRELELDTPIVFENGSGIAYPSDEGFDIKLADLSFTELKTKAGLIKNFFNDDMELITDMDEEKISEYTGLSIEKARNARDRIASLPFISKLSSLLNENELAGINEKIAGENIKVTKGGRFFHLLSKNAGKGQAVKKIIDYFASRQNDTIISVGIGDSENDIPMFWSVDIPFKVRKHDGSYVMTRGIETINKTEGTGPAGFSEAMKGLFL